MIWYFKRNGCLFVIFIHELGLWCDGSENFLIILFYFYLYQNVLRLVWKWKIVNVKNILQSFKIKNSFFFCEIFFFKTRWFRRIIWRGCVKHYEKQLEIWKVDYKVMHNTWIETAFTQLRKLFSYLNFLYLS